MEQYFSPTHHQCLQDFCEYYRKRGDGGPFNYTEVTLAVPVEEFLRYQWDWDDLWAFLSGDVLVKDKILWIRDDIFLLIGDANDIYHNTHSIDTLLSASSMSTTGQEQTLTLARHINGEDIPTYTTEVSVFWHAIATSNSARITIRSHLVYGLHEGYILREFFQESRPSLQHLNFHGFHFKEGHCYALASMQRTDLKIKLSNCCFDPEDVEEMFIKWFRHNQVLTELDDCRDRGRIFAALSGNKSVKKLRIDKRFEETWTHCLTQVLTGNTGIEDLRLPRFAISDESWSLLFRSLSTHPRIKFLSFKEVPLYQMLALSTASKITRINAILQMLQRNTVLHTIELSADLNDEEIYQNSILPRLEMNRSYFEVQRQALKRADPSIRPQLLGRALHVVRYNPNLVFQFLSENIPAFVQTGEEDEDEVNDGDREEEKEEQDSAIPLENDPNVVSGQKRKASS